LEINIVWRDYRNMCAIRFLRLEDFINPNNEIGGMIIHLEPQGVLFADVCVLFCEFNSIFFSIFSKTRLNSSIH